MVLILFPEYFYLGTIILCIIFVQVYDNKEDNDDDCIQQRLGKRIYSPNPLQFNGYTVKVSDRRRRTSHDLLSVGRFKVRSADRRVWWFVPSRGECDRVIDHPSGYVSEEFNTCLRVYSMSNKSRVALKHFFDKLIVLNSIPSTCKVFMIDNIIPISEFLVFSKKPYVTIKIKF